MNKKTIIEILNAEAKACRENACRENVSYTNSSSEARFTFTVIMAVLESIATKVALLPDEGEPFSATETKIG